MTEQRRSYVDQNIEDLSEPVRRDIALVIDTILKRFELARAAYGDPENRRLVRMPFMNRGSDEPDLADVIMVLRIISGLIGSGGVRLGPAAIERLDEKASWKWLEERLQALRRRALSKLAVGKGAQSITSLSIVRPKNSNRFKIVINGDYSLSLEGDCASRSWGLIFDLAERKQMSAREYKSVIDYFNTNKRCKLYSQTGYLPTKLLNVKSGFVVPAIPIKMISEKAFQQRLNRTKQT